MANVVIIFLRLFGNFDKLFILFNFDIINLLVNFVMRKRDALIHLLEKFKRDHPLEFEDVDINSVELYMDVENKMEIIPIIAQHPVKFKLIVLEILKGRYNDTLYKKEDGNITAMRFMYKGSNSRIYCLEIIEKFVKKKIVMARGLQHKTSNKNNKTNKPIIDSIKKYQYEFHTTTQVLKKIRDERTK